MSRERRAEPCGVEGGGSELRCAPSSTPVREIQVTESRLSSTERPLRAGDYSEGSRVIYAGGLLVQLRLTDLEQASPERIEPPSRHTQRV